jgi:NAD dependent epimerase/dehydratase family enzyme
MPEARDIFSIDVAKASERALADSATPGTRKLALRTAMVLDVETGTVYRVLRRLVRCGLGGRMGSGRQFVSWIHGADFCRSIDWLISADAVSGPLNVATPNPLPNRDIMEILRQQCRVPFGLPAARWMLELGALLLRTETELIIKSRRVVPTRLLETGFDFRFPHFALAVAELEQRMTSRDKIAADSKTYAQSLRATVNVK